MDNTSGTQEQQGLEHGVGEQVEHSCHVSQSSFMRICRGADTEGDHHKTDLGNGRESQHTLDVALGTGYGCCIEGCECSYISNQMQGVRSKTDEQREHACYQVNTGYHHCGSVDQGADRSRTFHSVRQPDVQREHGALSGTAHEHQSQSQRKYHSQLHQALFTRSEGKGLHVITVDQNTDQESEVGKTGYDECFLAGGNGFRFCIIESDEQVG